MTDMQKKIFFFLFSNRFSSMRTTQVTWTYPLCSRCPLVWLGLDDSSVKKNYRNRQKYSYMIYYVKTNYRIKKMKKKKRHEPRCFNISIQPAPCSLQTTYIILLNKCINLMNNFKSIINMLFFYIWYRTIDIIVEIWKFELEKIWEIRALDFLVNAYNF